VQAVPEAGDHAEVPAAAQGEPGDAGVGDDPADGGQAERLGLVVQLPPQQARQQRPAQPPAQRGHVGLADAGVRRRGGAGGGHGGMSRSPRATGWPRDRPGWPAPC
jgi:hypothetical protein